MENIQQAAERYKQEQSALESQQVDKTEEKTEEKTEDIVSRVSSQQDIVQNTDTESDPEDNSFDRKEIEQIQDPQAREIAQKAYDSLRKGADKKFREAAELRKELQKERETLQLEQESLNKWTPQRVESLLNNDAFKNAVTEYQHLINPTPDQVSNDEWSSMTDAEKKAIHTLANKVQTLEQQALTEKQKQVYEKQDLELSNRYKNYNPSQVSELRTGLINGSVTATNEHLWKVIDYEPAIKRAYELGKQDRQLNLNEKINATTVQEPTQSMQSSPEVQRQEGESAFNFLKRRMHERFAQQKNASN